MKTYTSKPNEDLGSIARKFGLPSWKYLYQLNKDKIGDNPDLLKEGTFLKIPQWDSTSGDEKIKAKGGDPFRYTGGMRYKYPWVPLSVTLTEEDRSLVQIKNGSKYTIRDRKTGTVLAEGTINSADEIEVLVPDADQVLVEVDGVIFAASTRGRKGNQAAS
jgi:LysM repeat protein